MATDDAALVAELRRWAAQADGPHGASHENIYSCPKCHGGHAGPELARVEWRRLLDLAEEAIRLRDAMDATTDCIAVWVDKAATLRAEIERLKAEG